VSRREDLAANLAAVEHRIAQACADAGRLRAEITLVAITKTFPRSDVELLAGLGITDVGENRHPEAAHKVVAGVRMHFVGGLQTNKAGAVAAYADVVESVDRPRIAEGLSRGAVAAGRELDVLIQVGFDQDQGAGRSGVAPQDVDELAGIVAGLPALRLRGVMTVAPLGGDPERAFARLAAISAALQVRHRGATTVSAGMSGDLEAAVAAGATHLRIGRSLLGGRVLLR
jgi:pyridoxal phosphate enzyme (YggS family)